MIRLSPAKINLGLRITGKRKDGYHTVHSVMIPVPFYDLIEIIPTGNKEPGAEFTQSGIVPDGSADENLCVKAYKLFSQHCKIGSARIHLHKQIPFGAGLGGGSSNAATVIISLNDLFGAPLSEKSLENMAAKLGSDCPFFLYHRPMLMEGRGEILTPIPFNTENYFLVIFNPGIIISTAEAYRLVKPGKQGISLPELIREPVNRWKDTIRNDFEEPVFKAFPELSAIKNTLYEHGALYASLSGSGSSIYAIFENSPDLPGQFAETEIWRGKLRPVSQI